MKQIKSNKMQRWGAMHFAITLIVVLAFIVTSAGSARAESEKLNIVLVHGAWADGSSWSAVIRRLQEDGYNVTAPQFPLTR
jgi:pimeloyl-ACP methyl ester carboxylesterase